MEYGGIVDEISEMRYTQICKIITAVSLSRQMKHLDISQVLNSLIDLRSYYRVI